MDKYTTFNVINSMLGKKYKLALPFSEASRAIICKCDPEQMHQILIMLYALRNTSDEIVKQSADLIKGQTTRTIGFDTQTIDGR